ncbi:hypothetical protein ACWDOP_00440 [Nocardia sp. NPDC003693]
MATTMIAIDDALLARIRTVSADTDLSAWIGAACRAKLLTEAARETREWERAHPDEAAVAATQEAVRVLEDEAEREICEHAERVAHARAGGTEPVLADYLAAYGQVRALLEQGEQRLRQQLGGEGA